jgi:hypothetical protein
LAGPILKCHLAVRPALVLEPSNHAAIFALQGGLAGFPFEPDLAEERQAEQKREEKTMKEYVLDANGVLRYFAANEGQSTNKV